MVRMWAWVLGIWYNLSGNSSADSSRVRRLLISRSTKENAHANSRRCAWVTCSRQVVMQTTTTIHPNFGIAISIRSCCCENQDQKQLGEEMVNFILGFIVPLPVRTGTQGKNLEAGTDAETIEGCCLLACSPQCAQLAFLYHP